MKPMNPNFLRLVLAWPALVASAGTVDPPPGYQAPVIAKVQVVFSMVSHHNHLGDRIGFYNSNGSPPGNSNYASPYLVYEPLVTLLNPHDSEIPLTTSGRGGTRVAIRDVPVGFRFKKNADYLRPEWDAGQFHGLARFQIANGMNPGARKGFILQARELSDLGDTDATTSLAAGTSATFSPWVQSNWTWGLETAGGYDPYAFADWYGDNDFTIEDPREVAYGSLGFHSVAAWDSRAGFQTDHLSSSNRPTATLYDFEIAHSWRFGWVALKLDDSITVESRAQRVVTDEAASDFQVDLMMGANGKLELDTIQELKFNLASLVQPETASPTGPSVIRTFTAGDLLQTPDDLTPGGKTPFAVLTLIAKPGALADGSLERLGTLNANPYYDFRFDPVASFEEVQQIGSLTPAPPTLAVLGTTRIGDSLRIGIRLPNPTEGLKVTGGSNLDSFPEDLTSATTFTAGPPGSGIHFAYVDVSGMGSNYFIRFEEPPSD